MDFKKGLCYRCHQPGHFARECLTPLGESLLSERRLQGSCAHMPGRYDWELPELDVQTALRNHNELRTLFRLLWDGTRGVGMRGLVKMLFRRFGSLPHQDQELLQNQAFEEGDSGFLQSIPIAGDLANLTEIEFQLGRRAEAHFTAENGDKRKEFIIDPNDQELDLTIRQHLVTQTDLALFGASSTEQDAAFLGPGWWHSNGSRHGIPATLHRISGISGRTGELIGVVIRIGRAVPGIVQRMLPGELQTATDSILFIGPPNAGKTTILRDFARSRSDNDNQVTVVVDKTSEIAGAANVPHPAIGISCRWVPVDDPSHQAMVMRKTVENLTPDVILVDEISTHQECESARSIAQRGVQLIATCHGRSFAELLNDEDRSTLLGGIKSVTLSKQEVNARAARGIGGGKQVMMRKYEPAFNIIVEVHGRDLWFIHRNAKEAIDAWLRREPTYAYMARPGCMLRVQAIPTEGGFGYGDHDRPANEHPPVREPQSMLGKLAAC